MRTSLKIARRLLFVVAVMTSIVGRANAQADPCPGTPHEAYKWWDSTSGFDKRNFGVYESNTPANWTAGVTWTNHVSPAMASWSKNGITLSSGGDIQILYVTDPQAQHVRRQPE